MGQEVAVFISDLNPAWPLDTDQRRFGAHHLRQIKIALDNTFPLINGEVTVSLAELNQLNGFDVNSIDAKTLGGQLPAFFRDADNLNAGTLANARVTQGNVTQHQAALVIGGEQIITLVEERTSSFSINAGMAEAIIVCNSSSTINVTLNGGVVAVGKSIGFIRRGTGAVNFLAGGGQTLNTPTGLSILVRHGKAVATYTATNLWDMEGRI